MRIFRALRICFFDGTFSVGAAPLPGTSWLLSKSDWFDCPFDWPTDCFVRGHLCIYNFITPMPFFRFFFRLSTHVICFCCSLVYTFGTSWLEIPNWWVSQRSIYNSRIGLSVPGYQWHKCRSLYICRIWVPKLITSIIRE